MYYPITDNIISFPPIQRRVRVKMAEDETQQQPKDNPYSFNSFVTRGSQNFDEVGDRNLSNETKDAHSRLSYQEKSNSAKIVDLFAEGTVLG